MAFIKLELDEENAVRFVDKKAYVVPDDRQAVTFAASSLRRGMAQLGAESLAAALKEIRESRNYLRMLLRRRKLATRRRVSGASS